MEKCQNQCRTTRGTQNDTAERYPCNCKTMRGTLHECHLGHKQVILTPGHLGPLKGQQQLSSVEKAPFQVPRGSIPQSGEPSIGPNRIRESLLSGPLEVGRTGWLPVTHQIFPQEGSSHQGFFRNADYHQVALCG